MSDNQLVLSDRTGDELTLYGAIFAGASIIWFMTRMPLPGILFILAGVGLMLFPSNLTVTADRTTRVLELEYHSRVRHSIKKIPFDDIANIRVEHEHSGKHSSRSYRVIAELNSGEKVPFHSLFTGGGYREKEQATKLHTFIFGKKAAKQSEEMAASI